MPGKMTVYGSDNEILMQFDDDAQAKVIKEIEQRTKQDMFTLLERFGFPMGHGTIFDYLKAKELMFVDVYLDQQTYDEQLQWICDFLGV